MFIHVDVLVFIHETCVLVPLVTVFAECNPSQLAVRRLERQCIAHTTGGGAREMMHLKGWMLIIWV